MTASSGKCRECVFRNWIVAGDWRPQPPHPLSRGGKREANNASNGLRQASELWGSLGFWNNQPFPGVGLCRSHLRLRETPTSSGKKKRHVSWEHSDESRHEQIICNSESTERTAMTRRKKSERRGSEARQDPTGEPIPAA